MFLVMTSSVLGKVARDALFLARFDARALPWADLSVALLVGGVVAASVRISRRMTVRNFLAATMVFYSASCAVIWVLAHYLHPVWLYPLFYVWVGIFAVLAPAQVWTLGNIVLTSREARRDFGFVGGGAISGWIAAGLLVTAMVPRFGTESLLLAMVLALSLCGVLVLMEWRLAGRITGEIERENTDRAPRNLRESVGAVLTSPYLRVIAAVIFLSSFATTVIGWQFKAIARQFFSSKETLALFFGEFNLFAGLLALAVQLAFTTRILRRFGIGPVLFCLPIALLAGSAGVIFGAGLVAAVLLRGADQVLRYSLDKPSVELLYVPVTARLKLPVKWFIDTVVWRAGDGLAAAALLMVVSYAGLQARSLGWLVALMCFLWGIAAWRARVLHVATLKQSVDQHSTRLSSASIALLGRLASDLVVRKLRRGSEQEILTTLDLIQLQQCLAAKAVVGELLCHPVAAIRARSLALLADVGDGTAVEKARTLLCDPAAEVRDEALRYLCRFSHLDPLTITEWPEFADTFVRAGMATFLAQSGPDQNLDAARYLLRLMVEDADPEVRAAAAQVLAAAPDCFDPLLESLLADPEPEVVHHAMRAVASLRKLDLVPEVLGRIDDPMHRSIASDTLAAFGDSIASTLADRLADRGVPSGTRIAIAAVLATSGTQKAVEILQAVVLDLDPSVRYAVLDALAMLRRSNSALQVDEELLESLLVAEVFGNYRTFQAWDVFCSAGLADGTVLALLAEGARREQERIFRILSALCPHHGFRAAYDGLQSGSLTVHDNALEFLDNLLKPSLRQLIVPLLESGFSPAARAQVAARLLTVEVLSTEEAVQMLLGCGDSSLRLCALLVIGALGLRGFQHVLDDCAADPDPGVRDAAAYLRRHLHEPASAREY